MVRGNDLREPLWFSAVGFMTTHAEDGSIQLFRLDRAWIISMGRQGSVAAFAGHVHMLSFAFYLQYISVTALASLVSGVDDRFLRYLMDCVASVVSKLSEATWNQDATEHDENNKADDKDSSQAEQMSEIVKSLHGFQPKRPPLSFERPSTTPILSAVFDCRRAVFFRFSSVFVLVPVLAVT